MVVWSGSRVMISALIAVTGIATPLAASALPTPELVSPNGPTAHSCPTFSWSAVPGAKAYELVVYAITPEGQVSDDPSLSARLPRGTGSWTPPADACLQVGREYGWSIHAIGEEDSGQWSKPALIEFAVDASVAEVEAALETLDRFLIVETDESNGVDSARITHEREPRQFTSPGPAISSPTTQQFGTRRSKSVSHKATSESNPVQSGTKSTAVQSAAMKVEGEVRTVDDGGLPRLWGKGRPDTKIFTRILLLGPCETTEEIRFGLSWHMVDWHSAAHACPAGSWVCTEAEIGDFGACNTNRTDSTVDGRFCSGNNIDFASNAHGGWLADADPGSSESGIFLDEQGDQFSTSLCQRQPVWCCF